LAVILLAAWVQAQPPASPGGEAEARLLFRQGHFQAAQDAFAKLIERQPTPGAYAGLVQSLLKQEKVDAAEAQSRDALELLPQSALLHATRGDVFFRRGLIDEAQGEYEKALKIDEKCGRAWLGRGRVDAALSHRKRSREAFTKAHELDGDDGDILYRWAVVQDYPENVAGLETHLAAYRSDADTERHEREYLDLIKAIAGRKIWILASGIVPSEIKLEQMLIGPGQVRGVGLKVRFNDIASARLLLDTGAGGITIGRKMAEKIKAKRLSDHSLEGAGDSGPVKGYMAWVDKITIGDVEFHDCVVNVSSKNEIGYEEGLIGANVFQKYLTTIDFPAYKLRLRPLPEAVTEAENAQRPVETDGFSQVFSFGHLLLMPTRVGDSARGLFALDTGAHVNTISPALARQVSKLHESSVRVSGVNGFVKNVYTTDKARLQFSRVRFPEDEIITFDVPAIDKDLGTEVSGFIGFTSLRDMKVSIDYRDGLVNFDYKPTW
jgi:tetratricopeptide (TPR) repeat protein